jgi:hypothetical protein
LGKVALAFEGRGNHATAKELTDGLSQSGIAEEEECLVVLHRTADGGAKLVAVVGRVQGCIPRDCI